MPLEWQKFKRLTVFIGEEAEKLEHSFFAGENSHYTTTLENTLTSFNQVKYTPVIPPRKPPSSYLPKTMTIYCPQS